MALSQQDWVRAALLAVAEGGVGAVAVEPLAARMGTTKGSFYWHFANRDALLTQMLESWERETTDDAIAELATVDDPVERLNRLLVFAMDDEDPAAPADRVLLSSGHDPIVGSALARVQAKRLGFLEGCFRDLGVPAPEARHRARIAYSAYLGWFVLAGTQADAVPSAGERAGYRRTVIKLLTQLTDDRADR